MKTMRTQNAGNPTRAAGSKSGKRPPVRKARSKRKEASRRSGKREDRARPQAKGSFGTRALSGAKGRRPRSAAVRQAWPRIDARLLSFLSGLPDPVFLHQEGRFLFLNASAAALFGADEAGELTGRPVLELVQEDYRAFVKERMRQSYEDRVPTPSRESKILTMDGAPLDVEATTTPVTAGGRPATLVIMRDITRRKQTTEALRESQDRLSALNANLADGMVYQISGGPDGRQRQFTYLSPAVEKFHGLTVRAVQEDPRLLYEQVIEEDRAVLAELEERAFTTKTKLEADVRVRMPSREVRWRRFVSSPRQSQEGNWLWDGIEVDVTEGRRAEAALRESEQRYILLFERSAVATSLMRLPEGFFVNVNDAFERLFGYGREEAIGKTSLELGITAPGDLEAVVAALKRRGSCSDVEQRVRARNGEERVVLVNASVIDFSGRKHVLATMQDITERERAREMLDRTNAVLAEIGRLLQEALRCDTEEALGMTCLAAAERLTQSKFGFIGEIGPGGLMHHPAISDSEGAFCAVQDKTGSRKPPGGFPVHGLCGKVLAEGRSFFTNEPEPHPGRAGAQSNGPALTSFLGVPLLSKGRAVGVVAVANREGGYGPVQQEALESLAPAILGAIGRKRAEEALERYRTELEKHVQRRTAQLQEAYARLQGILQSISDGFFVMNADWRLTYVNPQATRIWGIASENLIGRTWWELAPSAAGSLFEDQFRKAMRDRVPVVFEAISPITGAWTEVRVHPFDGGLSTYFHDITARRERDAERARLASAVESVAEGVVITDRKGTIQYVNPAFKQITGYAREDIDGRSIHFLDSGRHDDGFYRAIRDALRKTGVWRGRKVSRKKDGTLFFENCIISAVRNESGEITNYVTIMRDETEQLRLESIAAAMNSMDNLGYVFAGVRHEIGNPVNNAKMALSVLLHQLDGASREAIEGYTKRALTEIGRVERLLTNLKTFNMHEAVNMTDVDLAPLLEELVALSGPDLGRRAVAVTKTIGEGAGQCRADPRALLQVLLNLVTNAVDALEGREERRIHLETEAEGASVHIRVRDSGCGIPEEQQRQLFRPFFTSKPNGTGLGLVIVRNMLAQMGASIEITSKAGAGTVADIQLQRGEDHADTPTQDAAGH